MDDVTYYHCFVCGQNITDVVSPTGIYTCQYCGAKQVGQPINMVTEKQEE